MRSVLLAVLALSSGCGVLTTSTYYHGGEVSLRVRSLDGSETLFDVTSAGSSEEALGIGSCTEPTYFQWETADGFSGHYLGGCVPDVPVSSPCWEAARVGFGHEADHLSFWVDSGDLADHPDIRIRGGADVEVSDAPAGSVSIETELSGQCVENPGTYVFDLTWDFDEETVTRSRSRRNDPGPFWFEL